MSIPTSSPFSYHKLWSTRSNDTLTVSDMTTAHILASLAKCQRDNWRTAFIPIFLEELEARGFKLTHPELFI